MKKENVLVLYETIKNLFALYEISKRFSFVWNNKNVLALYEIMKPIGFV